MADPLPGFESYRGYVSIPYLSADGQVVSIRFRRPDWVSTEGPKYLGLPEEPGRVYNVKAFVEAGDELAVTEGEFDAMVLNGAGIPAVGYPGATFWKPHHRRLFEGFSRVWIFGDPDEAGHKFIGQMTKRLNNARGVYLTQGDVTDTYLSGGEAALREAMK